jgi:hypothetical protein
VNESGIKNIHTDTRGTRVFQVSRDRELTADNKLDKSHSNLPRVKRNGSTRLDEKQTVTHSIHNDHPPPTHTHLHFGPILGGGPRAAHRRAQLCVCALQSERRSVGRTLHVGGVRAQGLCMLVVEGMVVGMDI